MLLQKENVDEDILELGQGVHKVEVDIMQPIDPNKAPKVHQPALNHVGLWVDNIEAAVETLTAEGLVFTPGGIRKGAGRSHSKTLITFCFLMSFCLCISAGYNVCFIHPKSAGGVLVELVQAPDDVIAAKKGN